MKRFTLRCNEWSQTHAKFALLDPSGANCGFITIATADVYDFIRRENWNGTIDWNGKLPPTPAPSQKTGPE